MVVGGSTSVRSRHGVVGLQDLAKREDLRPLAVCSVDPPGCTDIDDALHCRQLHNGNLEVPTHTCVSGRSLFVSRLSCVCCCRLAST